MAEIINFVLGIRLIMVDTCRNAVSNFCCVILHGFTMTNLNFQEFAAVESKVEEQAEAAWSEALKNQLAAKKQRQLLSWQWQLFNWQ